MQTCTLTFGALQTIINKEATYTDTMKTRRKSNKSQCYDAFVSEKISDSKAAEKVVIEEDITTEFGSLFHYLLAFGKKLCLSVSFQVTVLTNCVFLQIPALDTDKEIS